MDEQTLQLTIEELAVESGVPVRTIRYYITEGLLSGPSGRGRAATYGQAHLARLRLIRRLVERRVPLGEIRDQLVGLSPMEIRELLQQQERVAEDIERASREQSPREYIAALLRARRDPSLAAEEASSDAAPPAAMASPAPSPAAVTHPTLSPALSAGPPPEQATGWRRWELAPGLELHVREDAERRLGALIDRILQVVGLTRR